jgi:CRISPR system Cascade subunit CasC
MSNNPYLNRRVEFHILQSFPVTCLNRDDVGAPKTAMVGGVTRARVSSQCWKRAVRLAMHEVSGVELGVRTKLLSDLVAKECLVLGATDEQAKACGGKIENIFIKGSDSKKDDEEKTEDDSKSDTLLFLAPAEVKLVAEKMKEAGFNPDKVITQKDAKKQAKELSDVIGKSKFAQTAALDGLDIALFGRMVAQAPTMDVEGAASFSHAISTHKVTNEVEFFTALDDFSTEQGSAHMGSLEFNAATYYRYICLDLGQLYETLDGDKFFAEAITAFIKAIYLAVPAARQTTQSGASSWDYAKVFVRKGQRLQLSCESPIKAKDGGYLAPSIDYVRNELAKKEKLSGSLFGKQAEYEFGVDENFSIDNLIDSVLKAVKA